jgi:transcription elongation factor Elf1
MTSVASIPSFDRNVKCARCGEQQIAPVSTEYVSPEEIKNLWQCETCGHVFETSDHLHATLPVELIEKFLPNLLVA